MSDSKSLAALMVVFLCLSAYTYVKNFVSVRDTPRGWEIVVDHCPAQTKQCEEYSR